MNKKQESTSIGIISLVFTFLKFTLVSLSSPSKLSTTVFHLKSIFEFWRASFFAISLQSILPVSCITETITFFANLVKNIPSSIAASPLPTTNTVLSVFEAASQVAQNEIPLSYRKSSSFLAPVNLGFPPEATITTLASKIFLNVSTFFISPSKSTDFTSVSLNFTPNFFACLWKLSIKPRPVVPSGNPG